MKRKMTGIILAGAMACLACGCGNKEMEQTPSTDSIIESSGVRQIETVGADNASGKEDAAEGPFSFSVFSNLRFCFASGAGGWATLLDIDEDGRFSGEYFDGEMGVTGEGYPNGTMYQSNFSGQFTQPVKVNDYTYSMKIRELNYAEEPGTEEIKDGTLYCYSKVYGLDGAENILIYLPGAPIAELPEGFRSWVGYYNLHDITDTGLPYYGLYNEKQECGFSSYQRTPVNDSQLASRLIESQMFDIYLDGWGEVTFASFLPGELSSHDGDAEFKLLKDGEVVYSFPGYGLDNTAVAGQNFQEVLAVAFRDIDYDNRNDILILNKYASVDGIGADGANVDGADAGQTYPSIRIYSQPEGQKEFVLNKFEPPMDEFLQKQHYNDNIANVLKGIDEYWKYQYAGIYNDYDTNEPNLEIQKNDDGTYGVWITIFRLASMNDGVGKAAENGLEFSVTAPNGEGIRGTITVEGDIATVTFTSPEWSTYSDINQYRYYKTSGTPDI